MTTFVNIGTLASKLGVTLRTLRFWEERGLIQSNRTNKRTARLYNEEQQQRAARVAQLTRLRFTLVEVEQLLDAYPSVVKQSYLRQIRELELERARINKVLAELCAVTTALTQASVASV